MITCAHGIAVDGFCELCRRDQLERLAYLARVSRGLVALQERLDQAALDRSPTAPAHRPPPGA